MPEQLVPLLTSKCVWWNQSRHGARGISVVFLGVFSTFCILGLRTQGTEARETDRPNIVFILADDLGYSDLGCYGGEIATPHLDALAANGLRYTQFYNTARCWPTRAALLTGYYAQQIGRDALPEVKGGARGKRPAWAQLMPYFLKPHGYRNYHSGKWHIDGKVLTSGFDRSLDMRNQGNFFTAAANRIDDEPITVPQDEGDYYATTAVVDHAVDCLREHQQDHTGTPFFHYLAFIAPHFPLHAPPEDIARYEGRYAIGWDQLRKQRFERQATLALPTQLSRLETEIGPPYDFPDAFKKLGPGEVNRPVPWHELTQEQQRFQATKMTIHAAMVDRMDQEIGRYVAKLKEMGILENTLIMFASDNGASAEIMVRHGGHDRAAPAGSAKSYLCLGPGFSSACNTPFRRHKTWVHEGGIATPLIVSWPAGIKATGELRTAPAHVVDFIPTVFDVLQIQKPGIVAGQPAPAAPGRSLLPTFAENVGLKRDCLWWLHDGHRALRVGDWKLVAAKGDPWELYDLSKDRAETENLAAQHPKIVQQLAMKWESLTAEFTALAEKRP